MSLKVVEAEVARFLSTTTPEVLCIKGKWGVGKTYGWRAFLGNAKRASTLKLTSYSYVSLFGLNSIDDLRYAIFENTVSGDHIGEGASASTLGELVANRDNARKLGKVAEWAGAFFNKKGLIDLISKSAFLLVRSQIICLDDLERAGSALGAREVLGLASQLREERKCKVVLLLNDEEHDERHEFERQLEKVADVTLTFDLTATEATGIGLVGPSRATELLKPRIVALGITNIRVIKKIERLAVRLVDLLAGVEPAIVEESIATLALASWSVQQPKLAPSLEFLRNYNRILVAMRSGREDLDPETARFRAMIADYPFRSANALDNLIIDGAEDGYFVGTELLKAARELERERAEISGDERFETVWENLYHGSLATEDDDFLDQLANAATADARAISPLNMNSTLTLLREFGRDAQADTLIQTYVTANDARGVEFFNLANHFYLKDVEADPGLRSAFDTKCASFVDERTPVDVIREMGSKRRWTDEDVLFLSKLTADAFVEVFEALNGDELRPAIEIVRALGQSAEPGAGAIGAATSQAFRQVGAKSALRRRKLSAYGIDLDTTEDKPKNASAGEGDHYLSAGAETRGTKRSAN